MYLTRSYLSSYVPDKVIPVVIFATKPGDIVIGCHTFATVLVIQIFANFPFNGDVN